MIDNSIQHTAEPYDILIVDDTLESLELLNRILEEEGYRVRLATNGRLALKSVAAKLPDLVLLDVKMPEMDGYEVCRRLKSDEYSRNVPVIFISSHGETAKKVEGFKVGGVDFIGKPFDREEVLIRVESRLRLQKLTEHLEQEVKQRTAELTLANQQLSWESEVNLTAAELSKNLLINTSIDDISYMTLEHAKHLTGSAFGFVGYIDQKTGYLVCPTLNKDIWERCNVVDKNFIFKKFSGLWGWVLTNRKSLISNAPADDPRSSGTPPGHIPIHRFLSAPSLIGDKLVGQISVANATHDYTDRELEVIERLANLYAIAVQRSQVEEELFRHRVHLEELVEERTAELEESNKELEAFAYSVSHDLRAPLRHVDGFLELLDQRIADVLDDQSQRYMKTVRKASERMAALIDDLLSFSRMGRKDLSKQIIDLNKLVQDVIRELEPETAQRSIDWHITDLAVVNADQSMLRTVFSNLISNALKFTRPRQPAKIDIGCQPSDKEVTVFIRDNGVGFDGRYANKLFGVFQRLHKADEFEGTGIGLANVRRIITRHGGSSWAEGQIDKGATFYFSLPKNSN